MSPFVIPHDAQTGCPKECKKALVRGIDQVAEQIAQASAKGGKCGQSYNNPAVEFPFRVLFSSGDMQTAFNQATLTLTGNVFTKCGAAKDCNCCECNTSASLSGTLTDKYDFCSSLKPGASYPKPWDPANPWDFAFCGCVLEKAGKLYMPKVECPVEASFKKDWEYCPK